MDPITGYALAGLAGSLGSSLLGNRGAKRRQQLADQNNIKFWQMQNKYNDPSQQMARLKKAGLNPALIYGSGSANTGVAGSIAPSKPAPYNIKDPVPSMLQTAMMTSQIDLQKSQAEKNRADANQTNELLGGKLTNLQLRNEIQGIKNYIAGKTKSQQINIINNSSIQSNFNTKIKEVDQDFALQGFAKGNPIGTIFAQLGIAGGGEENQMLRRALIAGLLGSQVINNLSGPLKAIITKFKK
jgi:hypothetical protein